MTSGERRLAERLEQKLDDDYLLWYDVPMGPRNTRAGALRQRDYPSMYANAQATTTPAQTPYKS